MVHITCIGHERALTDLCDSQVHMGRWVMADVSQEMCAIDCVCRHVYTLRVCVRVFTSASRSPTCFIQCTGIAFHAQTSHCALGYDGASVSVCVCVCVCHVS